MDWNAMARAMQREPFLAQGTEEAIEHGLKIAAGVTPYPPRQLHDYVPHKTGGFCNVCGYDRNEPLLHNL